MHAASHSGIVPLHPALSSTSVLQDLRAQRALHARMFSASPLWLTQQLATLRVSQGLHACSAWAAALHTTDGKQASLRYAASVECFLQPAQRRLVVRCLDDSSIKWQLPLSPDAVAVLGGPSWSPGQRPVGAVP